MMFISIKAAKLELRERCLNIDSKLHIGSPQVVVVVFVFNFTWRKTGVQVPIEDRRD